MTNAVRFDSHCVQFSELTAVYLPVLPSASIVVVFTVQMVIMCSSEQCCFFRLGTVVPQYWVVSVLISLKEHN